MARLYKHPDAEDARQLHDDNELVKSSHTQYSS